MFRICVVTLLHELSVRERVRPTSLDIYTSFYVNNTVSRHVSVSLSLDKTDISQNLLMLRKYSLQCGVEVVSSTVQCCTMYTEQSAVQHPASQPASQAQQHNWREDSTEAPPALLVVQQSMFAAVVMLVEFNCVMTIVLSTFILDSKISQLRKNNCDD